MRWTTYASADGTDRVGILDEGIIFGLDSTRTLVDLIANGPESLAAAGADARRTPREQLDWDSATLRAPLQPPSLRDSMCFHEHIRNCRLGGEFDDRHNRFPVFYFSNAAAVIGPRDDVNISPGCEMFDYELEVAAVIGRPGSNLSITESRDHIIGYTMFCDWSARDLQMDEMQLGLGPAKGKDGATTIGPVLVTADEIEGRRSGKGFDLEMTVAIDGVQISSGNWSTINWSFEDVVAYASRGTNLRTGDVLGSGTVGRGCLLEHSRIDPENFRGWLQPGEEVVLEVAAIGQLRQTVVPSLTRHPLSSGH